MAISMSPISIQVVLLVEEVEEEVERIIHPPMLPARIILTPVAIAVARPVQMTAILHV
jgi:hypothetical protein